MSTKNAKEIVLTQPVNADIRVYEENGEIKLAQCGEDTYIDPVTLPALIGILQSYVEQPKMRYFVVTWRSQQETGHLAVNGEEYPNANWICEASGYANTVITNIIELSEQDYNSFTK